MTASRLAEDAISSICKQILDGTELPGSVSVCVGAAGALAAPDACRTLAGRLSALIPTGVFAIGSDAVIAHAGALDGRPGLVLTLGTGAVVIGIADGSGLIQVDGWGPLLGDLGGGGWIGGAGLRAALAAFDGRGPATELLAAAQSEYGPLDRLPAQLGERPDSARQTARFAPTVARLARNQDPVSVGIMRDAAGAPGRIRGRSPAAPGQHGEIAPPATHGAGDQRRTGGARRGPARTFDRRDRLSLRRRCGSSRRPAPRSTVPAAWPPTPPRCWNRSSTAPQQTERPATEQSAYRTDADSDPELAGR